MSAVNYVIYGCSFSRKPPAVFTIQELNTGGKTLLQLLYDNLKRQIKN